MNYGHLLTGIVLNLKPKTINIMPFGVTIVFEEYNSIKKIHIKKTIIALAGPLTNILVVLFTILTRFEFLYISFDKIVYSNILIAVFNLLPIYPLDGGRIIKNIISIKTNRKKALKVTNTISNITMIILTALVSILILYIKNIGLVLMLGYLWYLNIIENKSYKAKERVYELINM